MIHFFTNREGTHIERDTKKEKSSNTLKMFHVWSHGGFCCVRERKEIFGTTFKRLQNQNCEKLCYANLGTKSCFNDASEFHMLFSLSDI